MKKPAPFGKYYLLERINVGGMAEVFRAKAFGVEGFERLVAVKRILSNIAEDKEFIRMFIEEAKLAVQLNHANIAQIFDLGVVDNSYYIALEHVHGRDLRGIFDRCGQIGEAMPVAQACFVAMKVCEGLDYAHNKRDQAGRELSLVHRDVSPQNILVSFEGEVKLIDFGIAKAAGTGAKTQAGILKGKFGYMSPEQVRGLPVDRRSDVFSCGIVLYELLTGERLFVGESDFSTLEKVRNVEILPPSTYNRKIPDELERIVLKALTKDVDDRYQHAIDLHDELQAFVYTAGEFYSRKDLAGWMKKTFGKEIEDETAKLESYRQLKPPPPGTAASAIDDLPIPTRPPVPRKPPPKKPTQQVSVMRPPPPPSVSRSQPVPVVSPASGSSPVPVAVPAQSSARTGRPRPTDWDDDDVETRVYEGDDDSRHKANRAGLPLQPPVSSSPGIAPPEVTPEGKPALTIEVTVESRAAAAGPAVGASAATWPKQAGADAFPRAPQAMTGSGAYNGMAAPPAKFPGGSNAPSPVAPDAVDPGARGDAGVAAVGRELSAPSVLVSGVAPVVGAAFDPMASFGAGITQRHRPGGHRVLPIVLGGAIAVAIAVIAVMLLSDRAPRPAARSTPVVPAVVKPAPVAAADPSTGFDLYVTPASVTRWKLDGESRTDRLPSRIRGISAGAHTVQIEPPPGFLSQHQEVAVELGKAPKIEIALQPIPGISGRFESTPPGATVSLIVDGKRQAVGASPAKAPLDPRSAYQVLFEMPGYVSVNRPITFSGGLEERIVVNLEKAAPPPAESRPPRVPGNAAPGRKVNRSAVAEPPPPEPASGGEASPGDRDAPAEGKVQGVLVLGSKPPCDIAIDGSPTGLHTPQKEIRLAVGRHRVTLSNAEFGIKETFTVEIKPDAPEKAIKDYSDRLRTDPN